MAPPPTCVWQAALLFVPMYAPSSQHRYASTVSKPKICFATINLKNRRPVRSSPIWQSAAIDPSSQGESASTTGTTASPTPIIKEDDRSIIESVRLRARKLEAQRTLRAAERNLQLWDQNFGSVLMATNEAAVKDKAETLLTDVLNVLKQDIKSVGKMQDVLSDKEIRIIKKLETAVEHAETLEESKKSAEESTRKLDTDQGFSASSSSSSSSSSTSPSSSDSTSSSSSSRDTLYRSADSFSSSSDSTSGVGPASTTIRTNLAEVSEGLKKKISNVQSEVEDLVSAFIKEDGTLDIGALKKSIEWSVDRVGEVWARLNGLPQAGAKSLRDFDAAYLESPVVWKLREEIESLEKKLQVSSRARESRLRKEDQLGMLIRAKDIRAMDDKVNHFRRELAVRVLELEMERIYLYLDIESRTMQGTLEERLLIAEFGDLDFRLAELRLFLTQDESDLIPDDQLGVLAMDIQDMKARLGLENDLYTSQLDMAKMRKYSLEAYKKTKEGLEFYWRGFKLIGGDLMYAWKLIRKAIGGVTLTPREVRTLRRTGRDMLTLIPFTIILIIPLSPVGHVLVFSFIQRFFPDFFPSTFSERRQALMKRYDIMSKGLGTGEGEFEFQTVPVSSASSSTTSTSSTSGTDGVKGTQPDEYAQQVLQDVMRKRSRYSADDLHLSD